MTIEIKYAELPNPFFMAGTNMKQKLDVRSISGLSMLYLRDEKELHVFFKGEMAIITNFSSIMPLNPSDLGYGAISSAAEKPPAPPTKSPSGKLKAQVSDPTRDVVFGKGE